MLKFPFSQTKNNITKSIYQKSPNTYLFRVWHDKAAKTISHCHVTDLTNGKCYVEILFTDDAYAAKGILLLRSLFEDMGFHDIEFERYLDSEEKKTIKLR